MNLVPIKPVGVPRNAPLNVPRNAPLNVPLNVPRNAPLNVPLNLCPLCFGISRDAFAQNYGGQIKGHNKGHNKGHVSEHEWRPLSVAPRGTPPSGKLGSTSLTTL